VSSDRALAELGRRQLIETVALTGHYSLVGLVVNGFDVEAPQGGVTF
jgi:hypothetical protein